MVDKARNLQGEPAVEFPEDRSWYQLSFGTWLLIATLVVINIANFAIPGLLAPVFHLLDVRLWPVWYLVILLMVLLLSIKWFLIYCNREEYDDMQWDSTKRFLRFSVTLSVALATLILVNMCRLMSSFYDPLQRWLGYGEFSGRAILAFVLILGAIASVAWFFKEWMITIRR